MAILPREQTEAVLLRIIDGLDVSQVAEVIGKKPGAVRVLQHRGLRRLAEIPNSPHANSSASPHWRIVAELNDLLETKRKID